MQNRQSVFCATSCRTLRPAIILLTFLLLFSNPRVLGADDSAALNEAIKQCFLQIPVPDASAAHPADFERTWDHSFEITKVSGNWDISTSGSASGRFLVEINATEGCYVPMTGDFAHVLRQLEIKQPEEETRLFNEKLNRLPESMQNALRSRMPMQNPPLLFQAAVPKGGKMMQTGKAELVKFGDAAWQIENIEINPITYQQEKLPANWRGASDLRENEYRIDDPKTKEILQTLVQKQTAFFADADAEIVAAQKEFDTLTEAVKKELAAKFLKDSPFEISEVSVRWTDKRAGDASGVFTAKAKTTEKRYQLVSSTDALKKLGVTEMDDGELNDTPLMLIDTLPQKYRDELVKMKPQDLRSINWKFYDVSMPIGTEIDVMQGTVQLVKYGDADWQVETVEQGTVPTVKNRFTPESRLPADARKLDDPKTLEAAKAVQQQRKEFAVRMAEVVQEWNQIREQCGEALKIEITRQYLAELPLEITEVTAEWDYTDDAVAGLFTVKTKAAEKLYQKINVAEEQQTLTIPGFDANAFHAALADNDQLPENIRIVPPLPMQGEFYDLLAAEGAEAVTLSGTAQLVEKENTWQIESVQVDSFPGKDHFVPVSKLPEGSRLDDPAVKQAIDQYTEECKAFVEDVRIIAADYAKQEQQEKQERMFAEAIVLNQDFLSRQGIFPDTSSYFEDRLNDHYLFYGNKTLKDNYIEAQTRLANFDPRTGNLQLRQQLSDALQRAADACERERIRITQMVFSVSYSYGVENHSIPYDGKSSFSMDFGSGSISLKIHDKNKIADEIIFPQQNASAVIPERSFNGSYYGNNLIINGSQGFINQLVQRANNFEVQIVFTNLRRAQNHAAADVLGIKIIDKRSRLVRGNVLADSGAADSPAETYEEFAPSAYEDDGEVYEQATPVPTRQNQNNGNPRARRVIREVAPYVPGIIGRFL